METWTIIVLLFVALVAYSLFFRIVGPDEMRRKSDARLLRALELAKQSSNKNDLPVVLAEVERRGLLKPSEQDDLNRLSQKQPPITQGSLKVSIDGGATELTFYELAETLVLLSMNGNYGLLFHDEDDIHYGIISDKTLEDRNKAQLVMAVIVSSVHYSYLSYRSPPDDKLSKKSIDNLGANFDSYIKGVEAGFRNLQVEEKNFIGQKEVDYLMGFFHWYCKAYTENMNMAFGTADISNLQGSKSAQGLLKTMLSMFGIEQGIDYKIASDGTSPEFRVDVIAYTLLMKLDGDLKISGKI